MSFDLQVVTRRKPRPADLPRLLASLQVTVQPAEADAATRLLTGEDGVIAELDGPVRVRPADLPAAAAGALRRQGWLLELSVRASGAAPWPSELANAIARAGDGVVFDPQQDAVTWPPDWTRRPAVAVREQRVDVLELTWFTAQAPPGQAAVSRFLDLLEAHFPAALPRRYGDFEPFQHRFQGATTDAAARFRGAIAAPDAGMIFWTCRPPCFGGIASVATPASVREPHVRPCSSLTLRFDARPLQHDPDASAAAVEGFAAIAAELECFYAAGVLNRDHILRRGTLAGGSEVGPLPFGAGWAGLPAAPVWLAWFGAAYAPLVRTHVHEVAREPVPGALLLQAGPTPMNASDLAASFPALPLDLIARRARARPSWLPGTTFTYGRQPPSAPAQHIPTL